MSLVTILTVLSIPFFFSQGLAQERLTIYYFGATSCGPCNRPEVIESLKKLPVAFKNVHTDLDTKFVMVCMDTNIQEGLIFIKKYELWDEISIGSHYDNELALLVLNKTPMPGLPHIVVYRDTMKKTKYASTIENRDLLKDIVGGKPIVEWVNSGMSLDLLDEQTKK